MMVVEPEKLVEPFAKAGADIITFHIEATSDPQGVIDLIRSTGKESWDIFKAINPNFYYRALL